MVLSGRVTGKPEVEPFNHSYLGGPEAGFGEIVLQARFWIASR
jgi:hypothetical protein